MNGKKRECIRSNENNLYPKERLLKTCNFVNMRNDIREKCIEIRQQSKIQQYLFLVIYVLGNFIYIIYWASFYSTVVEDMDTYH